MLWFTVCPVPICVPPVVHSVEAGPQRKNETLPVHVDAPSTVMVAASLTETEPVPMESPPGGIVPPLPSFAVVVILELQLPKPARTKSFRTAVVEVEERVSALTLEKHSLPRPRSERLIPPSYSSPCRYVLLPLLSVNGHGAVVPLVGFTMPQNASFAPTVAQFAAFEVAWRCRLESPQYGNGLPAAVQAESQV